MDPGLKGEVVPGLCPFHWSPTQIAGKRRKRRKRRERGEKNEEVEEEGGSLLWQPVRSACQRKEDECPSSLGVRSCLWPLSC